jgi:predicted transcriptional regulator
LKDKSEYTPEELGKKLGLDRTTVQKAVKRLAEKELVMRRQVNLAKGGYIFNYSVKNRQEIRSRVLKIVDKWHDAVINEIEKW